MLVSNIIILLILIVSLFMIWKYGLLGIIAAVTLLGSDTDSAGIMYAIKEYFPFWKIIIRSVVLIMFSYSVYKIYINNNFKKNNKSFMIYYFYPLLLVTILVLFIDLFRGFSLIFSLSEIIWIGIPFFFIWTFGSIKQNSEKVFLNLILYQALVTLVILILGPATRSINGVSYAHIFAGHELWLDLSDTVVNAKISIGNYSKQSLNVLKFAQYHNPNALGFYSVTFIATSIYLFIQRKIINNAEIFAFFLLLTGIIGWFNSLTRGPIFLLLLTLVIYLMGILVKPKTNKRVFLILVSSFMLILQFHFLIKILEYFLLNASNISFTSRISGLLYAFDAIQTSPLFGVTPGITDPVPHILPLKIAAYYGLPAATFATIPFFHIAITTFKSFFKSILSGKSENILYPTMLVAIIFGAYLTNGVIVYVLFWILLSESMQRLSVLKIKFYSQK